MYYLDLYHKSGDIKVLPISGQMSVNPVNPGGLIVGRAPTMGVGSLIWGRPNDDEMTDLLIYLS